MISKKGINLFNNWVKGLMELFINILIKKNKEK